MSERDCVKREDLTEHAKREAGLRAEDKVYQAFYHALAEKTSAGIDGVREVEEARRMVADYLAEGLPLAKTSQSLAEIKERLSLTWDRTDPCQEAAGKLFPDAKAADPARYLSLICKRFGIAFENDEETYEALLQAVLDERAEAQENREAIDRYRKELDAAEAEKADADDRARKLETHIESIDAMLRECAASDLKIAVSDMDRAEDVISKIRGARSLAPMASGYSDAILRTIARKCDVENVNALTREELVQRITDVLDTRLIPKGMRLRKVSSR